MSSPELDKRRLGKFLARIERIRKSDAVAKLGRSAIEMSLQFSTDPETGEQRVALIKPRVTEDELWLSITRCRVFFTTSEDCYLPKVADAVYNLAAKHKRQAVKQLVTIVKEFVVDGSLVGATSYSGRLEMDNGLGDGKLLGNDQVCMDYIYGVVLHEDGERRARLMNTPGRESVEHDVLVLMANLIQLASLLERQIRLAQEHGWFPEIPSEFELRA